MDEGQPKASRRVALLSPKAASDFSAIHTYTAQTWDFDQAERYAEFLKSAINDLVEHPAKGNPVADRPGVRERVVRWKRARQGHRIIYRELADGIYVLRILHTAMRWPGHI